MELADFRRESGEWLAGSGPESDIVVSSRVRLARNLAGYRFPGRASEDERTEIEEVVSRVIKTTDGLGTDLLTQYVSLESATPLDRLLLVERRLISKEHAHAKGARGVAYSPDENCAVMINEEDHLRIQGLRSGFDLELAWIDCQGMDNKLAANLRFAYSARYGYLTSCPTNVGTGIRVSVMLHLPALTLINHLDRVKAAVAKLNLAVRGLYGEGSQAHGDFFQISNQVTLGKTENDLIADVAGLIPKIIGYERAARKELLMKRRIVFEDQVWRSYGTLSSARQISSNEAFDCLSRVRMGIAMEIIDIVQLAKINELFLFSQPAHLQKLKGKVLDAETRDRARAQYIRNRLHDLN